MQERYGETLLHDPFYNPNLSLVLHSYELAFPPRNRGLLTRLFKSDPPILSLMRKTKIICTLGPATERSEGCEADGSGADVSVST